MNGRDPTPADALAASEEPAAVEPLFGALDPDPFMLPLEAAQIVVEASRGEIGLEAATRELVRLLGEGRLSVQGQRFGRSKSEKVLADEWAHLDLEILKATASSCGDNVPGCVQWTELRFRRSEVLAMWPPDSLTIEEACVFLSGYLSGDPFSARGWILSQFESGKLEKLYATPIIHWQEQPLPLGPSDSAHMGPSRPHPKHWRVRREHLLEAVRNHNDGSAWRTHVPEASNPLWVGYHLARARVVKASTFAPDAATGWLTAHAAVDPQDIRLPTVRSRVAPRALAQLERKSEREAYRAFYPTMILNDDGVSIEIGDRPNCCPWHSSGAALWSGAGGDNDLTVEQVEWNGHELQAAIDRQFPASPEAIAPASTESGWAKRGPKPKWDWEPIVAEAAILFAQSEGTMSWKDLVYTITDLAARQTGTAPSDTTAEERAARIRDAWQRISTSPSNSRTTR